MDMDQRLTRIKARAVQFYRDVLTGADPAALDALVAESYTPHCALLRDVPTLPAGREALRSRLAEHGPLDHRLYRIIADGDHVYVQSRYDGATPVAGADIFRFDDADRIVEHWNIRQPIPQDMASGVDRFAGGGDSDLPMAPGRPDEMKHAMTNVLLEMWGKGNPALVPVYYRKDYIQHNPDMPGGYDRILEIVETNIKSYIAATGGPYPVNIHLMGAEGDLIFVYYSIFMAGIGRHEGNRATNLDIFRIDGDNRMIEHWDVLQMEGEPLPDASTLF